MRIVTNTGRLRRLPVGTQRLAPRGPESDGGVGLPGPYLEVFARFRRPGWNQWGNEDVEENSYYGVARRKGHVDPQLRLLETPRGYGTKNSPYNAFQGTRALTFSTLVSAR